MGQVADLCKRVGLAQQRGKTGVHPVVSIGQDSYPHPKKEYGRIKYPTFEIVGWVEKGLFLSPDADEPELPVEKAPPAGGRKGCCQAQSQGALLNQLRRGFTAPAIFPPSGDFP